MFKHFKHQLPRGPTKHFFEDGYYFWLAFIIGVSPAGPSNPARWSETSPLSPLGSEIPCDYYQKEAMLGADQQKSCLHLPLQSLFPLFIWRTAGAPLARGEKTKEPLQFYKGARCATRGQMAVGCWKIPEIKTRLKLPAGSLKTRTDGRFAVFLLFFFYSRLLFAH